VFDMLKHHEKKDQTPSACKRAAVLLIFSYQEPDTTDNLQELRGDGGRER
jgi:hypothetical protein